MRKHIILSILLLFILANGWSQTQTIAMRIPDTTMMPGDTIDVPIYADSSLTGKNVISYTMQLSFNQYYIQPIAVFSAGTISSSFGNPEFNISSPGVISISGYGATPLTGKGKFVYIRCRAINSGGTSLSFTGSAFNFFNEGIPGMSFHNGYMSISALPYITVSPDTWLMIRGETKQFSSTGTSPFQWSVTNPAVASINSSGLLTGSAPGITKVVAISNNGLRDTTNLIEVRGMRLSIPTNLSQWQGADIDVPVNVTDLSGLDIYSGNFTINYNQNILTPIGIVQTGTLLASYPSPSVNVSTPGNLSLSFYGTTPLAGSGTLIFIRFHVSTQYTGGVNFSFSGGLFNESLPPDFTNGYFSTINLPTLSLSPNTGSLVAGETQQFTVNGGGIHPFTWSVNDSAVASVSSSGLMTALRSGIVKVTVVDSVGATAASGNFQIYDTRVTMPDKGACPGDSIVYYPILIDALPSGESVLSMQGTVSYNATYLTFLDIESTSTLTAGWTFTKNPSSGQLIFAGYNATPFNTAGTILYLKFRLKPGFTVGTSASVNLNNVTLNEGIPFPLVDINGYVIGVSLPAAPTIGTITQPTCSIATGSVVLNGLPSGSWIINPGNISGSGTSKTITGLVAGTYNFTVNNTGCASVPSASVVINTQPLTPTAPIVGTITQPTCIVSTGSVVLSGLPSGNWTINPGNITGAGTSKTISGLAAGTYNYTVNNGTCTSVASANVVINSQPITPTAPIVGTITQPTCTDSTGSVVMSGLPSGNWTINPGNITGSTTSTTISGLTAGTYNYTVTNASGCTSVASADVVINAQPITPLAEAGASTVYTGTPIQIGNPSSGPGTFSWLPVAGLNNPNIAQPLASPTISTTYTLTVDYNGCIATDTLTITYGVVGHMISGKTRYAAKANVGNPAPNPPTYNASIYNIGHVTVILKSYPGGVELARDTSDALGNYQFTGLPDGDYKLTYDKYTLDTMQWGNGIDAIDVTLLKYYIGIDTLVDPSRCFSSKYKKAANVDNNLLINAIDISRLKAKIGAPYNITKNFPRGNWVSLDKLVSISGSDVVLNLETICYGDYNASSVKYRDSLVNWNAGKSIEKNIILFADDYVTTTDPAYFELPLRISSTVKDFSALGLELHYAVNDFKLVSASMSHTGKNQVVKINPTLEEIIADDNDLLVTGEDGVIRVVYATTRHFDVAAGDEVIRLGFRPMKDMSQGILDFELSGTGIFGDQYGEEQEDTYLIIPKILVQGNSAETGFDLSGYPNPFNGHAILNYCLPEDGNVKISVYNTLGERVCVLINESQAVGKHTAEFICGELAQGMYTFKLDFTGVNKSKCLIIKMIH